MNHRELKICTRNVQESEIFLNPDTLAFEYIPDLGHHIKEKRNTNPLYICLMDKGHRRILYNSHRRILINVGTHL